MKQLATILALGGAALTLAACSNSDDASTEAMPETVEVAADEALANISEEPVADEDAAGPAEPEAETETEPETTADEVQ